MTKHIIQTIQILSMTAFMLSCGSAIEGARFQNKEPVTFVNDRINTPVVPEKNPFVRYYYHSGSYMSQPLRETLGFNGGKRAQNTNALDEVPNSTWFQNRIGVRNMAPEEVGKGTNIGNGPMDNKPWTVVSSKVGGVSIGFIIKDAKGEKFLLKFDQKNLPEAETAADVMAAKILWAAGYNVADDYVVDFSAKDLIVAPDAVVKPVSYTHLTLPTICSV